MYSRHFSSSASSTSAAAQTTIAPGEWLCDTQDEDCREPILQLIRQETKGIDVAFWFMEDARYVAELVRRHEAGVPVRVLVDTRANASKRLNADMLAALRDGGIPMREHYAGGPSDILHFKMVLLHDQNMLEFSKANYTSASFVPIVDNVNYFDEAIFFTNDTDLTNSFRRRFEDLWVDPQQTRDYANMTAPPARRYPLHPIHWWINFPPLENFSARSISRYNAETERIDAIVFRVTDYRMADAAIAAVKRGVPVRLITEPSEARNPARVWHPKHVDCMYMGGVQIMHRKHEGLMHQASVVMHGLGEVIFGSSNWTSASALWQEEHNYFYHPSLGKPWFFTWFANQFDRKWNDTTNYVPFQPLPPDTPAYSAPANGTTGVGSSTALTFDGGPWAHLYHIYLGTDPQNLQLVATNHEFIDGALAGRIESLPVDNLLPGTTTDWRVVAKTWAQLTKTGPTWSFTTAGTAPPPPPPPPPPPGGGPVPFNGTPAAVPGLFQAEDFDQGASLVAYRDADINNAGGAYRPTEVDITGANDTGGGYLVGWTRAGEWLNYTVNVSTTGTYTFEARVANIGTGAMMRVEVDGIDATGPIPVPDTASWTSWQTMSVPGVPLTAGTRSIRIVFTAQTASRGAAGNFNWFRFVLASSPPASEPPPPPPPPRLRLRLHRRRRRRVPPFGAAAALVPGIFEAENFDRGGPLVAYYDADANNAGNVYRTTDDVDITGANDTGGGYLVGWTRAGEWLKYTVSVAATGTYTLQVRLANIGVGASFRVEVDGVDKTGVVAVPDTGGWQTWQTFSVPGIQLTAGTRVVKVVFTAVTPSRGAAGNFNWFRFVEEVQ